MKLNDTKENRPFNIFSLINFVNLILSWLKNTIERFTLPSGQQALPNQICVYQQKYASYKQRFLCVVAKLQLRIMYEKQ